MSLPKIQNKELDPYYEPLNPKEIDWVFRLDITDILGVDLWSLLLDIDMMKKHPNYLFLDNPLCAEIRSYVQDNVSDIIKEYLTYNHEKFPNPQDQYRWIVDSEMEIRSILGRDLDVPYDTEIDDKGELVAEGEPLKYFYNARFQRWFDRLFEHLVKVGETHKFSRALIALRDDDEEEED